MHNVTPIGGEVRAVAGLTIPLVTKRHGRETWIYVAGVRVLDQTIYGLRIIKLEITKECNYGGAMWNEVSRNPH